MIDGWSPGGGMGGEVTFGALVGFSSGYALKKIGKATAFIIGCAFIASQVGRRRRGDYLYLYSL